MPPTASKDEQVLVVSHGFEPNYTVGFARGLATAGAPVLVVSSHRTAPSLHGLSIPHVDLRGSQDPDRSSLAKALGLLRYYARLFAAVLRHRGRPVHFIGVPQRGLLLWDAFVTFGWIRLWARPFAYTVHYVVPHGKEEDRWQRLVFRWIFRMPDLLVAHSRHVARVLSRDAGVPPERILILQIGLNEEVGVSDLSREQARERIGIADTERVVLFFGAVRPYKGLDRLLHSFERVTTPSVRLTIAGKCPDRRYAARIRQQIEASSRRESITWRDGFVAQEDVEVWFKAADVVVLPHPFADQSGIIALSLRFGVPVIVRDVGGMAEEVDETIGIVVDPEDDAALANAIDGFFADAGRFEPATIRARGEDYRWPGVCEPLLAAYEKARAQSHR